MSLFSQPLRWDSALLSRYDLTGPRYTSYPTAPQFRDDFSEAEMHTAIERSNASHSPLSLYFHIPFCESLCFYCGCNKVVTKNRERAQPYLTRMEQEMAWLRALYLAEGSSSG